MGTENLITAKQIQTAPSGPGAALKDFWKSLKDLADVIFASPTAVIGLTVVIIWVLIAVFAPLLTPFSPLAQDYMHLDKGPTAVHPLGTDDLGRDVWARVAFGARTILLLGGAIRGAPAGQFGFARNVQMDRAGAGSNDQRISQHLSAINHYFERA